MSSLEDSSASKLLSLSSSDQKPPQLIIDARGSVKKVDEPIIEVSQPDNATQLKQRIRQLLIASLDIPPLKLATSQTLQVSNVGEKPAAPEKPLSPDYKAIIDQNISLIEFYAPGDRLLQKKIPQVESLVISILETKKTALANLLKRHKSLTTFEASGRLILSPLSKPFEFNGNKVRSREITNIDMIEGERFSQAVLDDDPVYELGEIDFHTHIILPEESTKFDYHITMADLKAILESAPWFDPDTRKLQPRFRVHAILSIMPEKRGLLSVSSGRAVFSFYIMDLGSESAKKGQPPFGLSRVPRTIAIDF